MARNVEIQNLNYKRPANPYKIALTGACDVGKTSLFRRIMKKGFTEDKLPSGVDKCRHEEIFEKDETAIPVCENYDNFHYSIENIIIFRIFFCI